LRRKAAGRPAGNFRIGAAEPENPKRVLLHGQPGTGLAGGRRSGHRSGQRPRCDPNPPAVEGQTAISPAATGGLIPKTVTAPAQRGVACAPAPVLATNSAPQLEPGWHASAPLRSPAAGFAAASRRPLEIRQDNKAAQPRAVRVFWGPWPWARARWLVALESTTSDSASWTASKTWRPMGQGRPVGYPPCPAEACGGQIAGRAPPRAPGAAARPGRRPVRRNRNRTNRRRRGDYRGRSRWAPACCQSLDGSPPWLDDPWLKWPPHHPACLLDLGPAAAGGECPQALVTLPRAADYSGKTCLLQTWPGCARCSTTLAPSCWAATPCHSYRPGEGLSRPSASTASTPACRFLGQGAALRPRCPDPQRADRTGVLFAAAMAGAPAQLWMISALTVMQQSKAVLVEQLAAHGCTAAPTSPFSGCWATWAKCLRRRGAAVLSSMGGDCGPARCSGAAWPDGFSPAAWRHPTRQAPAGNAGVRAGAVQTPPAQPARLLKSC